MEITARDRSQFVDLDPVAVAKFWRWCGAVAAEAESYWHAGAAVVTAGNIDYPQWIADDDYATRARFVAAVQARVSELWIDWGPA